MDAQGEKCSKKEECLTAANAAEKERKTMTIKKAHWGMAFW